MIKKTTLEYYLLVALNSAGTSFIFAMYVTFLEDKGLDLLQINLVNVFFFMTMFLMEIPTGAFADIFGRKASFVLSNVIVSVGMFIYGFADNFWEFVLAEIIGAIGATFFSGAFDSWFVDKLLHQGYVGKMEKIFARASQIRLVVTMMSAFAGAILADVSARIPWFVGGTITVIGGLVALFIKEEYFVRQKFSFIRGARAIRQTVGSSLRYGSQNKNVKFILVLVVIHSFAKKTPDMEWQLFFSEWLPSKSGLGLIWIGISLSMLVGAYLAPRLRFALRCEKKTLVWLQVVSGLGIALTTLFSSLPAALGVFLIYEVARAGFEPIKSSFLHDNIPSKERATICSFESIAHHGSGMFGLLFGGLIAKYAGIPSAWITMGILLIVVTLLVSRNGK